MTAKPSIRIKTLSVDPCVCGHCHLGGECHCGCTIHETESQSDRPSFPKRMIEDYDGVYHKGWHEI